MSQTKHDTTLCHAKPDMVAETNSTENACLAAVVPIAFLSFVVLLLYCCLVLGRKRGRLVVTGQRHENVARGRINHGYIRLRQQTSNRFLQLPHCCYVFLHFGIGGDMDITTNDCCVCWKDVEKKTKNERCSTKEEGRGTCHDRCSRR